MQWLTLLETNTSLLITTSLLLGVLMGSFLNVVIYRLPIRLHQDWAKECSEYMKDHGSTGLIDIPQESPTLTLFWPRSHCIHCKTTLSIFENIPVLSYLVLRGRCRHCNQTISGRYVWVEILTAILSGVTVWHLGYGLTTLLALFLTWCLITVSFIDLEHQIIPDNITLPGLWLGLLLSLGYFFTTPESAIVGAAAGYLSFWLVFKLFKWTTGKEGMGYGDFKLMALLGAWLGWESLPIIILISSLSGSLVGVGLMFFKGHDKSVPIPFGPFIAIAGWIALLWGDSIVNQYLNFVGLT